MSGQGEEAGVPGGTPEKGGVGRLAGGSADGPRVSTQLMCVSKATG